MAKPERILLDLNNAVFQDQLFALDVHDVVDIFAALQKVKKLDWGTLYKHKGFHWASMLSRISPPLLSRNGPPCDQRSASARLNVGA